MSAIETYYLIDFENVHEDGLSGSGNLGKHDHVFLFSTKNTPKISFEKLPGFNNTKLVFYEVPAGKESLDRHLVSYLGYLIGKNTSDCKYIIVSKDAGYDNIISFWKRQENKSNIIRQDKIVVPQQKVTQKSTVATKPADTPAKKKTTIDAQKKIQLNTEIQQALSNAEYCQSAISKTASIVAKHYRENKFVSNVHNDLRDAFTDYIDIYRLIKPIMTKYSSASVKNINTTTQINSQIQKILSHANYSNDIINHTASIVSRHYNKANSKQTIYREIIAKYGQDRGRKIYNHIKGNL